jgi:5-methylcytosine-specific restriction endonuclease McrA
VGRRKSGTPTWQIRRRILRELRDILLDRQEGVCWLCGKAIDRSLPPTDPRAASIDHILPRSRGGSDAPSNLAVAHRRCNEARADADPPGPGAALLPWEGIPCRNSRAAR